MSDADVLMHAIVRDHRLREDCIDCRALPPLHARLVSPADREGQVEEMARRLGYEFPSDARDIERAGLVVLEAARELRGAAAAVKEAATSLDWAVARLREERQAVEAATADLRESKP